MKHVSCPCSWLYRQKRKGTGSFLGQGVLGQPLGWAAVLCALPGARELGAHPPKAGTSQEGFVSSGICSTGTWAVVV